MLHFFRQHFEKEIAYKIEKDGGDPFYSQEIDKFFNNSTLLEKVDHVTCQLTYMYDLALSFGRYPSFSQIFSFGTENFNETENGPANNFQRRVKYPDIYCNM